MNLEIARDISIIVLAILAVVQLLLLITLTFLIYKKVGPLLDSAKSAVDTVQATTAFVAETTVHPIIRVISAVTGARSALNVLSKRQAKETKGGGRK